MLGRSKYDSGKLALKDLKLLNLEQRRVVHDSVLHIKDFLENYPKIFNHDINHFCLNFQPEEVNITKSIYRSITLQNLKNLPFIEPLTPGIKPLKNFLLEKLMHIRKVIKTIF